MVPKPKKSPKIDELCLKLVKFVVFTQKIAFGSSEKFHLELALTLNVYARNRSHAQNQFTFSYIISGLLNKPQFV